MQQRFNDLSEDTASSRGTRTKMAIDPSYNARVLLTSGIGHRDCLRFSMSTGGVPPPPPRSRTGRQTRSRRKRRQTHMCDYILIKNIEEIRVRGSWEVGAWMGATATFSFVPFDALSGMRVIQRSVMRESFASTPRAGLPVNAK